MGTTLLRTTYECPNSTFNLMLGSSLSTKGAKQPEAATWHYRDGALMSEICVGDVLSWADKKLALADDKERANPS